MEEEKNTIFGFKGEEKVFLGKEEINSKLRLEPTIEKIWEGTYVVCNGVVGDFQQLIRKARKIASEEEFKFEEVRVKQITSVLQTEVNETFRNKEKRGYKANLIFGTKDNLIYLDATEAGQGSIYQGEEIYARGNKAERIYGLYKSKKSEEELREGLDKILKEYKLKKIS